MEAIHESGFAKKWMEHNVQAIAMEVVRSKLLLQNQLLMTQLCRIPASLSLLVECSAPRNNVVALST